MTKSKILFSADSHFFHDNIRKYSNRPFVNVSEMNEALVNNWNSVVTNDDIIYFLGDFAMGNVEAAVEIYKRLNGKEKHLIIGNHDKDQRIIRMFTTAQQYKKIYVEDQKIILMHYAMRVWDCSHHGSWKPRGGKDNPSIMLHGHSHGSLQGNNQSLDVGVDCWNYYPITLEQIEERLVTLPIYSSGDHHVAE